MTEMIRTTEEAVRILRKLENGLDTSDPAYAHTMLGIADRYISLNEDGTNSVKVS